MLKRNFSIGRMLELSGAAMIAAVTVVALSATAASAADRQFYLNLKNGANNDPATFKVSNSAHPCYEGYVEPGQFIGGEVGAGDKVSLKLARVQGNDCDGKQGKFALEVSTYPNVLIRFEFDNSGNLKFSDRNSQAYGTLSAKAADESFTFETNPKVLVTAGKAVGQWIRVCQQFCDMTFKQEITNTTTTRKETSSEVTDALSVSLSAGIEVGGASAGMEVTKSQEQKTGQSMSQELSTSGVNGVERKVVLSLEQMEDRNLFAVWQWVAKSRLSNGQQVVLTTTKYTCTPDAAAPGYLPGSSADVNACQKRKPAKVAAAPVAAAPAAAKPARVAAASPATNVPSRNGLVKSSGGNGDVTNFTLTNDTKAPFSVSWIDSSGKEVAAGDPNHRWISNGESFRVENGAKTYESHWFSLRSKSNALLCSVSFRQNATVNLSQLSACHI